MYVNAYTSYRYRSAEANHSMFSSRVDGLMRRMQEGWHVKRRQGGKTGYHKQSLVSGSKLNGWYTPCQPTDISKPCDILCFIRTHKTDILCSCAIRNAQWSNKFNLKTRRNFSNPELLINMAAPCIYCSLCVVFVALHKLHWQYGTTSTWRDIKRLPSCALTITQYAVISWKRWQR